MTEIEARAIVMRRMEQEANEEYPVAWVGDMVEETPEAFWFEATTYTEGEDPREEYAHFAVDKLTGRCTIDTNIVLY